MTDNNDDDDDDGNGDGGFKLDIYTQPYTASTSLVTNTRGPQYVLRKIKKQR